MNAKNEKGTKKDLGKLTPRQIKAMDLILSGLPLQEVAGKLGVSRQTVSQWKNQDEKFRSRLGELQTEAEEELRHLLPSNSAYMLGRLRQIAADAPYPVALDAVKFYFDRFGPKEQALGNVDITLSPQDAILLHALQQQRQHDEKEMN